MAVWAFADLHLAKGAPEKDMAVFGSVWQGYMDKIEASWHASIKAEDLILMPGDISWAMRLEEALVDLRWIDTLPGTKVMIRGNHDYWWTSLSKMRKVMPPSIHLIHNSVFNWNEVTIGGTRLWDTSEYQFGSYVAFKENPQERKKEALDVEEMEKIFTRELERLKLSLQQLQPHAKWRIALTHYPPISADLASSRASEILESFKIDYCVFGHLHNLKRDKALFGEKNGVHYVLSSCDYLDFTPIRIL